VGMMKLSMVVVCGCWWYECVYERVRRVECGGEAQVVWCVR
jgi:hypothetical protein